MPLHACTAANCCQIVRTGTIRYSDRGNVCHVDCEIAHSDHLSMAFNRLHEPKAALIHLFTSQTQNHRSYSHTAAVSQQVMKFIPAGGTTVQQIQI